MSVGRRLAQSTSTITIATLASRLLGFLRDALVARLFGTGMQSQALVVAFRLPNLLRDLVAEGAVTSAVVPVLSASRTTRRPDDFWRLAQAVGTRMLVASAVFGVLGIWLAPWLVRLIAPGFLDDPEKFALTVRLTRLLFPFITLVGVWAFYSGLLNSLGHFAAPAWGSAVLNVAMVAGCFWFVRLTDPPVVGQAWAILIGGVLQLLIQLPPARRLGFRWRWVWRHEGSRDVMRLLTPRLVGSAVHQLSVFFNTIVASLAIAGEGAVSALYFANRLVQLPLALFGVATAQASLPALSELAAAGRTAEFRSTLAMVLRMVAFVTLPSAFGLLALSEPIVRVCLEYGAFDRHSTLLTARTLTCFSVGLLGYSASKVLSGALYALHDTRAPVRLALEAFVVNMVLAAAFIRPLQVGGLALAASLASLLNAWRLFRELERRLGAMWPEMAGPLARMATASIVMGYVCWLAWPALSRHIAPPVALLVVIATGMLVYAAGCVLCGVQESATIWRWLSRHPLLQRLRPSGGL
jgi:putative peptidoglycan lipid II flippase